jgi:hypothetical protein
MDEIWSTLTNMYSYQMSILQRLGALTSHWAENRASNGLCEPLLWNKGNDQAAPRRVVEQINLATPDGSL